MCKVVTYLVNDVMIVISSSLSSHQLYCHFYIDTKFVSSFLLTSNRDLLASSLSSLSGSIISLTPTDTIGKTKSETHKLINK